MKSQINERQFAISLFVTCLAFYALMNYGGIRSPDNEIVFRTADSLESGRGFAVEGDLERWEGFGVAPGKDGNRYSIFGPVQSIICVPLVHAAKVINNSGWYESSPIPVPLSHWVGRALLDIAADRRPKDLEPHGLRCLISFFNALITSVGVMLFWLITRRFVISTSASIVTTVIYAFGTLTWPYSGTFFSEPLAIVFVLLSFYLLTAERVDTLRLVLSGLLLGIATATHITAILFAPFFAFYGGWRNISGGRKVAAGLLSSAVFMTGMMGALVPLGYYNYVRFGSFLETGRTVDPSYVRKYLYGEFVMPWRGLYGLLISGGKGVVLYCPVVIAGIFAWGRFHRRYKVLSLTLAVMLIFRLVFLASRSDWHGGFCIGPRYMLMAIPFILLPLGVWLEEQFQSVNIRKIKLLLAFGAVCVAQQIYFCMGEVFSYLHFVRWLAHIEKGLNLIENDRLYLNWIDSPLFCLLREKRGPFLMQWIPVSNDVLWLFSTIVILLLLALLIRPVLREIGGGNEAADTVEEPLKVAV